MLKKFDKGFIALDEFLGKEDWRGAMKYLTKSSAGNVAGFWRRYEEALGENMGAEMVLPLLPHSLLEDHEHGKQGKGKGKKMQAISLPLYTKKSPQRQYLVRSLCRSYTHLAGQSPSLEEYRVQTAKWCEELLSLEECHEDIDGLVGRSEGLLFKEEWDEAVRVLEKAFEQGGRQVSWTFRCTWWMLTRD
jgi:DnaJ family protein C protein 3